jgi:hypothetical protein
MLLVHRVTGIAVLTTGLCIAATPLATADRQSSSPQTLPEVTRWRGLYECWRMSDTDTHRPFYDEVGRSELVGSVRFELERDGTGSEWWSVVRTNVNGTYRSSNTSQSNTSQIIARRSGSFSGAVADSDISFNLREDGTWGFHAGGILARPYTIGQTIYRRWRYDNQWMEETRNESTDSKSYPHWAVRGKLPTGVPGLIEGTWDKRTVIKSTSTTDHQYGRVFLVPEYADLELVVALEGTDAGGKPTAFDKWLPRGRRDEGAGASISATATLQHRDGSAPRTRVKQFRFELRDTSREPGVALNWPNLSGEGGDRPPPDELMDLRFDDRVGQTDAKKQRQTLPPREDPRGRPFADTVIQSFDFGAWSDLVVVAELADGREITGHLEGDPEEVAIPIPKRTSPSFIADAWKEQHKVSGADSADDETEPVGEEGCDGDGLTLYEEYRGFFEGGRHIRTNPKKKDLFIFNPAGALNEEGINLFQRISGLEVHKKLLPFPADRNTSERSTGVKGPSRGQADGDDDTLINGYFDRGPHRVMQHFVRVYFRSAFQRPGGGYVPKNPNDRLRSRPKDTDVVYIDEPDAKFWQSNYGVSEADSPRQHDVTVAHELSHTVGVEHHGDGDGGILVKALAADDPENPTGRPMWFDQNSRVATPVTFLDEATGRDLTESWASTAIGLSKGSGINVSGSRWDDVQGFTVGKAHRQHSGNEDCVMRYWLAEVYPKTGAANTFYVVPDGTEPVGSHLCTVRTGTSVNKTPPPPSQQQSRYFDADPARGRCKYWVCVNDAIPARSFAQSGGGT